MARMKTINTAGLSGIIGGIVVVQSGDKTFVRSKPDFSKTQWSQKQNMVRDRFRKVNDFCARYKNNIIIPIWNLAVNQGSGYHHFLKFNIGAFNEFGEIADLAMLHFSDGELDLPFELKLTRDDLNLGELSVSWQNEGIVSGNSPKDELMMVTATVEGFEGPISTGIARSSQQGIIKLPGDPGEVKAVYLFFASPDRTKFSPDRYFGLA